MQAGRLKYDIEILQKVTVKDDFGSETVTWNTFLTLKSDVRYESGTKQEAGKEVFNSAITKFIIRYDPSIDDTMRVRFNNNTYSILFPQELEFKRVLQLTCEKINE